MFWWRRGLRWVVHPMVAVAEATPIRYWLKDEGARQERCSRLDGFCVIVRMCDVSLRRTESDENDGSGACGHPQKSEFQRVHLTPRPVGQSEYVFSFWQRLRKPTEFLAAPDRFLPPSIIFCVQGDL
jgi:hypothetical protein